MLGAVRPLVLAFGLTVATFSARLNAQGNDAAAAEQLFVAARAAMEKGDFTTACERFAESQRLDPAAGTLINLADCLDRQGKIASAWQRWKEALDMLRPDDERRAAVSQRAQSIEARVPKLELQLSAKAPPGTTAERDGVALGSASFGISLPVDPGPHRIVAKAPGRAPREYALVVKEGESSTLDIEPGDAVAGETSAPALPAPASPAPAPPVRDEGAPATRTWGFVGIGIGAAGLLVGGVAGVLAISKKNEMEDACHRVGEELLCTSAGIDAAESGNTFATVANVSVAVGLVGVAAGAYLLLTSGAETRTSAFVRPTIAGATAGVIHSF
jgi:hypothetical protein